MSFKRAKGALRCNTNQRTYPRICQAVISGQANVVKRLIAAGEDPNRLTISYMDYTPLHWAIAYSQLKIAKILLDAGADIDTEQATGQSPLHQAIVKGDLGAVLFLISHGADIEKGWARDIYEIPISAAKHAIMRGDAEIFRALVRAGAVTTFRMFDTPAGGWYPDMMDVHACRLISFMYELIDDRREALLQVLADERPEEVMEWWASQPGV